MISKTQLYDWCAVQAKDLEKHPNRKTPFRLVADSAKMGQIMAREFCDDIKVANTAGRAFRAIVPCGPRAWYEPFTRIVNDEKISLKNMIVFHMDECLDWQGQELPINHPYNFKTFMLQHFYGGIATELNVPEENRVFLTLDNIKEVRARINEAPIDYTLGGWGQDGHVAYNQTRRNPYSSLTLDDLRNSTIRIQENNLDTIFALAQRTFGSAYQFVPPMSVTLGIKECMSAKKVRVYSDTGAWKQTALRVALFSAPDVEYPMTLLQEHPDALITATVETATHPISENPDWEVL